MLPVSGVFIGLGGVAISCVVGVSGAIDFALFYVSGQALDRFGRLSVSVLTMLMMAVGFSVLALTSPLDASAWWFLIAACLLGVANAPSSVVLLTLGADLLPNAIRRCSCRRGGPSQMQEGQLVRLCG